MNDPMEPNQQCTARNRSGERCGRSATPGATVCASHGSKAPQVRQKAVERVQEAEAARIVAAALPFGAVAPVDPLTALSDLINHKVAEVSWLRARVAELGDTARVWGPTDHEEGIGPLGAIDKTTEKAGPHTWWSLLRTAEDQLARFTVDAIKVGITERRVQVAEQQAAVMVAVVHRALARMNLTPPELESAHAAFALEFRAFDPNETAA